MLWQQRYTHAVVLAVAERFIVRDLLGGVLRFVAVADILVIHAEGGTGGQPAIDSYMAFYSLNAAYSRDPAHADLSKLLRRHPRCSYGHMSKEWGNMTPSAQMKPPKRQFRMRIEEVSSIRGRGTLVTGPIEQGVVAVGDGVEIVGPGAKPIASVVLAVTVSGRLIERGHSGDTVGVLLRAVNSNQVTRGQVLRAA